VNIQVTNYADIIQYNSWSEENRTHYAIIAIQ